VSEVTKFTSVFAVEAAAKQRVYCIPHFLQHRIHMTASSAVHVGECVIELGVIAQECTSNNAILYPWR
jgi:hypothetical protein